MTDQKLNIVFRVDASKRIGTGHVMRCLSLAEELRSRNAGILFMMRETAGNLCDSIEKMGYRVFRLAAAADNFSLGSGHLQYSDWLEAGWETDAEQSAEVMKSASGGFDWLVVDHYALDSNWEKRMRPFTRNVMVIDDLADRQHDCDILLDQNYYRNPSGRYQALLSETCSMLLGPSYALLRREFPEMRKNVREKNGIVKRILILFGGIDKNNDTATAVRAVILLRRPDISVDVVVGESNLHKNEIKKLCVNYPNVSYHCMTGSVAKLMAGADLSIGAGGITTWERCCLGLPSFVTAAAPNQIIPVTELDAVRVLQYLGESHEVGELGMAAALNNALSNGQVLIEYSRNSMALVDGLGAQRAVDSIERAA